MGQALCQNFPVAKQVFEEADEALGFSLSNLCAEGPSEALAQTANTQPAILCTSIAALRVLESECELQPKLALGHSLGEFSALVAAGALAFADAVRVVRIRGEAMQAAVPEGLGSMAAILGLEAAEVEALCETVQSQNPGQVVAPANENGGGQIVVAGHKEAVAQVVQAVKERKSRAIMLRVSAPFHCSLMQPAAQRLEEALADIEVSALRFPVIANVDAQANQDAERVKSLLVQQVTGRVRWEASIQEAVKQGAERAIEIGQGRVLAGLVKRIAPALRVQGFGSPAELDVIKDEARD